MSSSSSCPVVLTFAGLDPSGGAGIQADIETLLSMGCHTAPIVTCLTVQDTQNVYELKPIEASFIMHQARVILNDMPVSAIKIGLLGSVATIEMIHSLLVDYPNIPVVLDPILKAGGGHLLSDDEILHAMRHLLLPHATLITPNTEEATLLALHSDSLDACAMSLLDQGCEYALITGTHNQTKEVHNSLYGDRGKLDTSTWERLPEHYHGSGCTLSSAITGLLAQGDDLLPAVRQGQEYTWQSLKHACHVGMGQAIPRRIFWADTEC